MGCAKCDYTGKGSEYDETAGPGWVDIPCPHCHGVDGKEPDWVTEYYLGFRCAKSSLAQD